MWSGLHPTLSLTERFFDLSTTLPRLATVHSQFLGLNTAAVTHVRDEQKFAVPPPENCNRFLAFTAHCDRVVTSLNVEEL